MPPPADPVACLGPTPTLDTDHPAVQAFAATHAPGDGGDVGAAVRLFRAVRDEILYDPYTCVVTVEALRASTTLERRRAWCVPKAVLLAAACRASGIPACLGFADVRNHVGNASLRSLMGTDVYAWHGFACIHLGGRWIKATPAFNERLCRAFGLVPVEFDGRRDSLLHPTDASGRRHVEYVADRGLHDDTPVEDIRRTFEDLYPALVADAHRRWARGGSAGLVPDARGDRA